MNKEDLSTLTDQELLDQAKKIKPAPIMSALIIGIMIGVVIYSAAKNTIGFFTLIPLYFIYRILNKDKKNKALQALLKERNLE